MADIPSAGDGLELLSVQELRKELRCRNIDTAGCLEKSDLVERLRQSVVADAPKRARTSTLPPEPPSTPHVNSSNATTAVPLTALSVAELRRLLGLHGALHAVAGASEKCELVAALANALGRCPICLDDVEEGPEVSSCDTCRASFHRPCAAGHALAAADSGRLPLLCPVPGCCQRWPATLISRALSAEELERYNTSVRNVRELRKGSSHQLSPRTEKAMESLGIRKCPKCGAAIQKQDAGITHGCDKMTCRCGCKFCFKCGALAGPRDEAMCGCVGAHHSYLSHDSVMKNYADDPMNGVPLNGTFPFNSFGAHPHGMPAAFQFGAPAGGAPLNFQDLGAQLVGGLNNMAAAGGLGSVMSEAFRAAVPVHAYGGRNSN